MTATDFYRRVIQITNASGVAVLVAGALAFRQYTGIVRRTKDLDLILRRQDMEALRAALQREGFRTEIVSSHWLGKVWHGRLFVDLIFGLGNGVTRITDDWFLRSVRGRIFDEPVMLCGIEHMIWSKCYVMERERFDGADVAHLIRYCSDRLDWKDLLYLFGDHWQLLYSHLIHFTFTYSDWQDYIPVWVMDEMRERLACLRGLSAPGRVCRGTLVSRAQYLHDVNGRYADARLQPAGGMTAAQIAAWTAAIAVDGDVDLV